LAFRLYQAALQFVRAARSLVGSAGFVVRTAGGLVQLALELGGQAFERSVTHAPTWEKISSSQPRLNASH
jgi:hypothetical protein